MSCDRDHDVWERAVPALGHLENARQASEPQFRQAPPSPKADLGSGQKNRPFRAYSDAGIRCLGANLLPVAGHIRPVRDGLDREAKRGWLCTRPSVQRSIDIIWQKSGDRQEICENSWSLRVIGPVIVTS